MCCRPGLCLSHLPGREGIAFPLACPCSYHFPAWRLVRSRCRRLSVDDMPQVPVLVPSSSHHLVRRWRLRSHRHRVPPRSPRLSLFSSGGVAIVRRTAGVSHPSFVSFSYELVKTAHDWIARSSLSDVPWLLVSLLVLPSRRGVSCRIVVVVFDRSDGRVLRFFSLASRRGSGASFVHPAAWRCACPHPSPVVSFASRPSVSCGVSFACSTMPCGFGQHGVLARPIVSVLLVRRGLPLFRGVLPCLLVSSDCSSRVVGRGVRSRLVSRLVSHLGRRLVGVSSSMMCPLRWRGCLRPRGLRLVLSYRGAGVGFSSYPLRKWIGGGFRLAVSGAVLACLDAVGGWGQCRSRHRRSRLLPIILWLRSVRPCGVPHLVHRRLLLAPVASLLSRAAHSIGCGEAGGGATGCLCIGVWFIMSRRWVYIMNMMYAIYIKDIKIQGYENTIDI